MKLSTILITLLLIGGFVSGYSGFYGALMAQYGNTSTNFSSLDQSANVTSKISSGMGIMGAAQGDTIESTSYTGALAPLNLVFAAYNAGMLVLSTPNMFYNIIADLWGVMDMPLWVKTMLYGIIGVIVLFSIVEFITGRPTE